MKSAKEKLLEQNNSFKFVCVGLDTDFDKIPSILMSSSNPILEFNKRIIEATSDLAAAYKFNLAFYEKFGSKGLDILYDSIYLIPKDNLIIGDGKRGDIGNTSAKYAEMFFDEFKFDAVTLNPLMGYDSVEPFLSYDEKLNFILVLTSNPGANDFERLRLHDNSFLYQYIIKKVKSWNSKGNCGLVFGANNFDELICEIDSFEKLPVLLPGVGAQGGNFENIVRIFKEKMHNSFFVNISRSLIYKSCTADFEKSTRDELIKLNQIASDILKP